MDYDWLSSHISTCRERLFCVLLFNVGLLAAAFVIIFLISVMARVILNIINCIVVGILHLCDKCCVARLAPVEEECTAELIELRTRTLSWSKNAIGKVKALKGDYKELKRRSERIGATVHHWPGV